MTRPPLKYINIHTHHVENDPQVMAVINLRAGENVTVNKDQPCSFGVHPWDTLKSDRIQQLDKVTLFDNLMAIGECGLDKIQAGTYQQQEELFIRHIHLAEKFHKPLIIHCVGYFNEIITLKKDIQPHQPWIIHGFKGHPQLAGQFINAGVYLSFGAAILKSTGKTVEAFRTIPANSFLLETDDTQLSIREVYARGALLRNIDLAHLQSDIANNFNRIFKPHPST